MMMIKHIVVKNVFYVFFKFFYKNMFLMFFSFCVCFILFKKNIYNILTWPREPQYNAYL